MTNSKYPFTILALAPFCPVPESQRSPEIVSANLETMDEAVATLGPRLFIPVPGDLCPEGSLTIDFNSIKDFRPHVLVKKIPFLKRLHDAGKYIDEAMTAGIPVERVAQRLKADWSDLPLDLSVESDTPQSRAQTSSAVDDILSMVAASGSPGNQSVTTSNQVKSWKARIESILSGLLECVFSDPSFRTYESAWSGAKLLARQGMIKEGEDVVLKMAPISMDALSDSLDSLATELTADLPDLILIDLPLDSTTRSMELMEKVADFADTLMVPTITWITPHFFHLEEWKQIHRVSYLSHYMEDAGYAKWRKLREHAGSDWLVVTCNRFLGRLPYGDDNPPRGTFFKEKDPVWLSPVWALGALVAQSVDNFGWPTRFTDYVKVSLHDLPVGDFCDGEASAVEAVFSEDRIAQFVEAGITPLVGAGMKDVAFTARETTLAGGSLKFQFFFSRLIGFLIRQREELGDAFQGDPSGTLEQSLSSFFQQTGHRAPEDLSITAGRLDPGSPVPLKITLTPPYSVLPTSQKLEFTFSW